MGWRAFASGMWLAASGKRSRMASRQDADLVGDMNEAISRIRAYTAELSYEAFLLDTKTQDAVVRKPGNSGRGSESVVSAVSQGAQGRELVEYRRNARSAYPSLLRRQLGDRVGCNSSETPRVEEATRLSGD